MRTRLRALWLRLRGWMGMGKPPLPLAPSPVRAHKCAIEGETRPGWEAPDDEFGPFWNDPIDELLDVEANYYCLKGETGALVVFQFDARPVPGALPVVPKLIADHLQDGFRVLYGPTSLRDALEYMNDVTPRLYLSGDQHCPKCYRAGGISLIWTSRSDLVEDALGDLYRREELVCLRCGHVFYRRVKDGPE